MKTGTWKRKNIQPFRVMEGVRQLIPGIPADQVFWPFANREMVYREIVEHYPTLEGVAENFLPTRGEPIDERVMPAMQAVFDAFGRRIFYEDARLHEQLSETDIGNVPTTMLQLPFPAIYVSFGDQSHWQLYTSETGMHSVDGAYLYLRPKGNVRTHPVFQRIFEGTERTLTIVATGLPNERSVNVLDDANQWTSIPIKDGLLVGDAIEESYRVGYEFRKMTGEQTAMDLIARNAETMREIALHLAKLAIYMNLPEARRRMQVFNELEYRMREATRKKKAAKAQKAKERAARSFNVVRVIGPASDAGIAKGKGSASRHVRPHWRRGHFRMQAYGPGLQERKVIWIEPVLVNRSELAGEDSVPDAGVEYRVR